MNLWPYMSQRTYWISSSLAHELGITAFRNVKVRTTYVHWLGLKIPMRTVAA